MANERGASTEGVAPGGFRMPDAITARGITRSYGERVALDGFSLSVTQGSVFGLLGPNGSGKSTFITLAAAMDAPPDGSLAFWGMVPSRALRRRVGVVFQENAQDPLMSVSEHLALAARLFGIEAKAAEARGASLLQSFGLAERAKDPVSTLSGGMRRRLEAARALMHNPDLLLLDEPTAGVDPGERTALWKALLGERQGDRTILLATNDLAEADAVCDHVAFISGGRVVASGTPAELKQGLRRDSVTVAWAGELPPANLGQAPAIAGAGEFITEGNTSQITVDDASGFVPALFARFPGAIRAVSVTPASLEDAYFRHVGRRVAGAGGADE